MLGESRRARYKGSKTIDKFIILNVVEELIRVFAPFIGDSKKGNKTI